MAMKCCTKLETAKERCPIVFQGHPSNFKVTRYKTILTQIGRFRTIGRSQLSNPSDLPCFYKECKDISFFGQLLVSSILMAHTWNLGGILKLWFLVKWWKEPTLTWPFQWSHLQMCHAGWWRCWYRCSGRQVEGDRVAISGYNNIAICQLVHLLKFLNIWFKSFSSTLKFG